MWTVGKWLAGAVVVATVEFNPCAAQSATAARSWATFTAGLGAGSASMRGDTVYEGGGQIVGTIGYARGLTPRSALEIEALGGHSFATGDCIPGFSICAPSFMFVGAAVNLLSSMSGPVAADRFVAGVGAGVFRVAATDGYHVSPRAAPGLQARVEYPLITGSSAAFALSVRGLVIPRVHGQTLGVALLTASLRTW